MALYGVIGDIHGNLEALGAVIALMDRRAIARLLCVGDVVGYNADGDGCAALLQRRDAIVIAGNHDLISTGRLDLSRCGDKAAFSLRRTRRSISAATAAYLAGLPAYAELESRVLLIHGGLRDPQHYMRTAAHVRQNALLVRQDFPERRLCFFGHTHEQKLYELDGDIPRERLAAGLCSLDVGKLYFINPGSVDASRKREHKLAECALFDSTAWSIEFHSVAYDYALAEEKATTAGYRIGAWTSRMYRLRRRLLGSPA